MGKRSRKRREDHEPAVAREPRPAREPAPAPAPQSRSEAKNAAVRAQLVPLAEGERPLPVTIGAIVAVGLVVANVIVYAAGLTVRGDRPAFTGFVAFSALMLVMAVGLWKVKYWAVLGLQALLGLLIVIVGLVALVFKTVWDLLICLAILIPSAVLFWYLVKAMARIQMPQRPERRPR